MDHTGVTYRETFNTINSTLAEYGTLGITLKQCNTYVVNINRPQITLINNLMIAIKNKHDELNKDLRVLDTQQQNAHDTRLI